MGKINLQCNNLHKHIHGGSAEPSLAEIHQEMSELLDKQVNAQKEKIFRGSRKLPQAHEKSV